MALLALMPLASPVITPVALLVTEPASRSAWVTVWTAVHLADWPGANEATSQTGAASTLVSVTATAVTVTLPVLVTVAPVTNTKTMPRVATTPSRRKYLFIASPSASIS